MLPSSFYEIISMLIPKLGKDLAKRRTADQYFSWAKTLRKTLTDLIQPGMKFLILNSFQCFKIPCLYLPIYSKNFNSSRKQMNLPWTIVAMILLTCTHISKELETLVCKISPEDLDLLETIVWKHITMLNILEINKIP